KSKHQALNQITMKIKPMIAAVLVLGGRACFAQTTTPDVIASAGSSSATPNVSLSWTVGEPISETGVSSANYLTQGFEQPQTIVVTDVTSPVAGSGNVTAYPNPFTSIVSLQNNNEGKTLNVELTDMDGKTVFKTTMVNKQQQFDLSTYSSGIYFLRVYDTDNKLVQTLKIDKIK
ncbi:MAG TPA: T9SS type A sorting domain-containing protein, partial [Bacteroidia bacterium]|nr:T9SS type A sorting domain-containing protein [Bacteroidia bacterium]